MHILWPYSFAALALTLLFSGLDDLIPLLIVAWHRCLRRTESPSPACALETKIAIFVPCWKESAVIGNMVRHNLNAIRYKNFDIFLGVYPNDEATIGVARELSETFANVHVAICPRPGPTSKADCLNSIYQDMCQFERRHNVRFETVVLHDAEDLIHSEALGLINRARTRYDMVQVPVLPLPTPFSELTHGVYCDEFAEFQNIDMHARQFSGSFVPSNGVGTGFARRILERLAWERGQVFDAESLTEDYEIGVYIHDCGYRQLFAPITRGDNGLVATREYFPRTTKTAIRQRTRWVTGIALQCWERRGWAGSLLTRYWFWRDRKGLVANPLSLLTNFIFLGGLLDFAVSAAHHRPWIFAFENPRLLLLCGFTTGLQCLRLGVRMLCVARIYGPLFAMGVPMRSFLANLINCFASIRAVQQYFAAKREKRKLAWQKTEHAYPAPEVVLAERRDFEEVLVDHGFLSAAALAAAKQRKPASIDLADFLRMENVIADADLCRALSLFCGAPIGSYDADSVKQGVRRALPVHLARRFNIVPVDLREGRLVVASHKALSAEQLATIRSFTSLNLEYHLTTQTNFSQLESLLN